MHLASAIQNGVTDVFDNARQAVGAKMWMCGRKYVGVGSVLAKNRKNLVHIPTFFAARIKFAVRVSPGSPFAKRIIAFGVNALGLANARYVAFALVNILAAFKNHGFQTKFYELQRSKETARTGSHNYYFGSV